MQGYAYSWYHLKGNTLNIVQMWRNVGEYYTIDLVKDNTKNQIWVCSFVFFYTIIFEMQEKVHNVLFKPRCNLDFTRWHQCMCNVLDWSNESLYFCSKCCIKTAQMCRICLLITFRVQNCALSSNNSMVFFHCNSYCQLDSAVRLTRI